MKRRVPHITATATDEVVAPVAVQRLTTMSDHHKRHDSFTTAPSLLTAGAWISSTAETMLAAKPVVNERVSVRIYKLRKLNGVYEVYVSREVEKPREYEANNPATFAKFDAGDGALLDGFFSGQGDGAQLREQDAVELLAAWANTTNPEGQTCVQAARALSMRCAIRRGVMLHSGEAF